MICCIVLSYVARTTIIIRYVGVFDPCTNVTYVGSRLKPIASPHKSCVNEVSYMSAAEEMN